MATREPFSFGITRQVKLNDSLFGRRCVFSLALNVLKRNVNKNKKMLLRRHAGMCACTRANEMLLCYYK